MSKFNCFHRPKKPHDEENQRKAAESEAEKERKANRQAQLRIKAEEEAKQRERERQIKIEKEKNAAATKIQSHYKGYRTRKRLKKEKLAAQEEEKRLKKLEEKRLKKLEEEKRASLEKQGKAKQKQSVFGCFHHKHRKDLPVSIDMTSGYDSDIDNKRKKKKKKHPSDIDRKKREEQNRAATKIQSSYRGFKARKDFKQLKATAKTGKAEKEKNKNSKGKEEKGFFSNVFRNDSGGSIEVDDTNKGEKSLLQTIRGTFHHDDKPEPKIWNINYRVALLAVMLVQLIIVVAESHTISGEHIFPSLQSSGMLRHSVLIVHACFYLALIRMAYLVKQSPTPFLIIYGLGELLWAVVTVYVMVYLLSNDHWPMFVSNFGTNVLLVFLKMFCAVTVARFVTVRNENNRKDEHVLFQKVKKSCVKHRKKKFLVF